MEIIDLHAEQRQEWLRQEHVLTQAVREYDSEAADWRSHGILLSGRLNAAKTVWRIAYRRARVLRRGLRPVGVPLYDASTEARHAWLRAEQQPRVVQRTPQSDFENSPYWRIALFIAAVVIGIQVFSPNPDAPAAQSSPSTVRTGHIRATV